MAPLQELQMFAWVNLKFKPQWNSVEAAMTRLSEKKLYDAEVNACELHKQFGYVKNYCTEDKIKQWRETKTTVTSRWVEIFCHLRAEDCEFKDVAEIVEYVLCLPATSASVERVFSAMNRTWTEEKTRLNIETLKAILMIKYNLKFSCTEFYTYLKTQPTLLRQIAGTEKYKRKRDSADENSSEI